MLLHNSSFFRIYFGNVQDQLYPHDYLHYPSEGPLLSFAPYSSLKKIMDINHLFFLRQVHSASGVVITAETMHSLVPFVQEGDFLITNERHVGIGIMTADCLPLIIYDRVNRVVAAVHAGWRGSVKGVAVRAIKTLQEQYGTDLEQLKIYFGPCAKVCCYQIGTHVVDQVTKFAWGYKTVQTHGDNYFFDLPLFNKLQLESVGVKKEAFRFEYTVCTIDDLQFCSYRRQKEQAGRQMSVVCLK